MAFKNLVYALTCLSFSIIIGAGLYEHVAMVPRWSAAPPQSLSMFQGEYRVFPEAFWKMIHPVTILLFIATLILSWKSAGRPNVVYPMVGYIVVMVVTAIYFVPELIEITTIPFSNHADPDLTQRAATWEILSLIRLVILVALNIVLLLGLSKIRPQTRTNASL